MKINNSLILALALTTMLAANAFAGSVMYGTVHTYSKGNVTVHSYVAPDNGFNVNTQIIETPNKLVVVDAQMVMPMANEVRAYIDSLGKPVDRVIISHIHPDHWFGLEAFKDMDIYALPQVKAILDQAGESILQERRKTMGDLLAKHATIPNKELKTGTLVIDGVRMEIESVVDGEADLTVVIKLPEQGVVIAQDLVFNELHAFYGQKTLTNWANILDGFIALKGYNYFPAGHGNPTSKNDIRAYKAYLLDLATIVAKATNGEEVKKAATKAYPEYKGAGLLDISALYEFKK